MQEFIAHRMSSGNKLFPDKVTITDTSVTLRSSGFLNGKEKSVHYHEIISVESDSPMMGFSTIKFKCIFDSISCSGFSKEQVEEMKRVVNTIIANRNGYGTIHQSIGMPTSGIQNSQVIPKTENEHHIEREKLEMEKKKLKQERADKLRQEGRTFHALIVEYDNAIIGSIVTLVFIIFFIIIKKS